MAKTAIVSGYATIDYAARLPAALHGPGTATVEAMTDSGSARGNWPQAGGAALYACTRIASAGHRAGAMVTLGNDANAVLYLEACRTRNVAVDAISRSNGARTPWCMLLYHDDGSYTCLIDRGEMRWQPLSDAQLLLLAHADFVCVTAGCARTSAAVLDGVANEAPLAWIVKRDSVSFPEALCARLARRADLIFCNGSERPMVDSARANGTREGQAVIETRGAEGVRLHRGDRVLDFSCEPVRARDTTGAGDTLAGEVIATVLSGNRDLAAALERGIDAARQLLLSRVDLPDVPLDV